MAGLGRKLWTRQTLSSADLQGYLQDQVVMRFANSAARQAQLPAPAEGMISTLDDTDDVQRHDGTSWVSLIYPGPWQTPASQARANYSVDYQPLRFRLTKRGRSVEISGMVVSGAAGTLFTLPVGYRPLKISPLPAADGAAKAQLLQIAPTGAVQVPADTAWLAIAGEFPLD